MEAEVKGVGGDDKNERYQPPGLPGSVCGGALYASADADKKRELYLTVSFPSSAVNAA